MTSLKVLANSAARVLCRLIQGSRIKSHLHSPYLLVSQLLVKIYRTFSRSIMHDFKKKF